MISLPQGADSLDANAPLLKHEQIGTDLDAAIRLADRSEGSLLHAEGVGWLWWDGRRWATNSESKAIHCSMLSARDWTKKCWNYNGVDRDARMRAAKQLEGVSRIKGATELAKKLPGIAIDHASLDANPWRLTCLNGTLDLQNGELRPHNRSDLITKLAPVVYYPDSRHTALEHILDTLRQTNPDLPNFLARCFGVTLTGDVSAETLFLLQGEGGSGKTTLTEAVASMMGDYSCKLAFESLCHSKFGRQAGSATPDLVPIRGARLVYATEGDALSRLDSGKVKELTGGEPISVRPLYQPPIKINPTWKIWLVSNFDPRTESEDSGLWRRLVKLHFSAIPAEKRDIRIKEALLTEENAKSAVLAWAVRGCLDWQQSGRGRTGLRIPLSVTDATESYRTKQDTLALWWEDLESIASFYPEAWTPSRDLRDNYLAWCKDEGVRDVSPRRLSEYLERRGLKARKGTNGCRGWDGISF